MAQALTERPTGGQPNTPRQPTSRLRATSRTRNRAAAGLLVALLGVLVNLAVYRGLNDKTPVLQLARDVPAGAQITVDDFRVVKVGADGPFRAVASTNLASIVGSYAKVRLVAGTLLAQESLQRTPLVAPGAAVVAVVVSAGEVPIGLRERSRVEIVLTAPDRTTTTLEGLTVGLPGSPTGASVNQISISVEVSAADAARMAGAERVRLVLLEPVVGS